VGIRGRTPRRTESDRAGTGGDGGSSDRRATHTRLPGFALVEVGCATRQHSSAEASAEMKRLAAGAQPSVAATQTSRPSRTTWARG